MQNAARKVAWENARLRDMLISRGVSAEEIAKSIYVGERTISKPTSLSGGGLCRSPGTCKLHGHSAVHRSQSEQPIGQIQSDLEENGGNAEQNDSDEGFLSVAKEQPVHTPTNSAVCHTPPPGSPILERDALTAVSKTPDFVEGRDGCVSRSTGHSNKFDKERHDSLPTITDCFCPPNATIVPSTHNRTMLEMSCETAAGIIVGMRGDDDMALARTELGCVLGQHCTVKNVHVLEIMELDE
jgi:hypothetical protein